MCHAIVGLVLVYKHLRIFEIFISEDTGGLSNDASGSLPKASVAWVSINGRPELECMKLGTVSQWKK